jgi:FKBP-type peptidyl-prolyl cis-trans isomerase 2
MEKGEKALTKKKDFVEIEFTGYANNELFDSNVKDDLKKLDTKAEPKKTIVSIGEKMLVVGLDKALEGKEIGKEYEASFGPKEGFGERRKDLIRTIPMKVFLEKQILPKAGMVLNIDDYIVKVVSVSGGRVLADFNNPLAGKEIRYKFRILKIVEDEKEKCEAVIESLFKIMIPFEIRGNEVVLKGPKGFDMFVNVFKPRFKELMGKELVFEEVKKEEKKSEEKKQE